MIDEPRADDQPKTVTPQGHPNAGPANTNRTDLPDLAELNRMFSDRNLVFLSDKPIGVGGMGVVYQVRQGGVRTAALKIMKPANAEQNERLKEFFESEMEILASLDHENIVKIFDWEKEPAGRPPWILMEYVDGVTLRKRIGPQRAVGDETILAPVTLPEILSIVRQVCAGLEYAHERVPQIIHRDLKPENVMITRDCKAKIMDFGLAKMVEDAVDGGVAESLVVGTPGYIAPERGVALGMHNTNYDHRVDIYAVGVMLYELLTGHRPSQLPPPGPSKSSRFNIDPALDDVVMCALEKEPARRYRSASDLSKAISQLSEPGYGTAPIASPSPKRTRLVVAVGIAFATLAVIAAAYFFRRDENATTVERQTANVPTEFKWSASEQGATLTMPGQLEVKFRRIPAGNFIMGSALTPEQEETKYGGRDDAGKDPFSQHEVTLSKAFWLGQYEVTNGEFETFVKATGYKTDAEREGWGLGWEKTGKLSRQSHVNWRRPGWPNSPLLPVVVVSWNDAQEYVRWLNQNGPALFRLPTEAEWEYACRAGTTTEYQWGDNAEDGAGFLNAGDQGPSSKAWRFKTTGAIPFGFVDGYRFVAPVGTFQSNAWGLFDMHGNVYEWCQDRYGPYTTAAIVDPTGPVGGKSRVVRGGSWASGQNSCRSSARVDRASLLRSIAMGFRLARSID